MCLSATTFQAEMSRLIELNAMKASDEISEEQSRQVRLHPRRYILRPVAVIADNPVRCYSTLKTLTMNSSVHLVIARAINA